MTSKHLAGDRIELWVGTFDAVDRPPNYAACYTMLSPAEKQRAGRFVHERHRRQYVFAHGLLRIALSDVLPALAPSAWAFTADRFGRPFVAAGLAPSRIHFSLSHTDGCVACVVSAHEAVGVDVECVKERRDLPRTANSVFSTSEIASLHDLAPHEVADRFFDYWTLKEAYIKARGRGLMLPLDQFSMSISGRHASIAFGGEIDDDPRRWHFTPCAPSPAHRLAIADGTGTPGGLPILHRSWPRACDAFAA